MGRCYILKKNIAESLLEIKAVSLRPNDPFTWTSGIQSPIYCDNRLTLSYPEIRRKIAAGLANIITEKFSGTELVAGKATTGNSQSAWGSGEIKLSICFLRFTAKRNGKRDKNERKTEKSQKGVVVVDLILN